MKIVKSLLVLLAFLPLVLGCGPSAEEKAQQQLQQKLEEQKAAEKAFIEAAKKNAADEKRKKQMEDLWKK